jgi:hypothetical protein
MPFPLKTVRGKQCAVLLALVLLVGVTACAAGRSDVTPPSRQEVVATRGAAVMPFDLERTIHVFEKTEDGGLQQVIAVDSTDGEQVALIRAHLADEAERFHAGDFHDQAMIYGEEMPGLHELVLGADRITVVYRELPDGAEIRYTTGDSDLVAAIHAWFDAQLSDHGDHATTSHDH